MRGVAWRVLLASLLLAPGGAGLEGPLSEEEVVRLHVAGRPTDELVREIERREPGFDLSPEMLEELRQVELPAAVIDAMLRRQREQDRLRAERSAAAAAAGRPLLRLRLNPGHDGQSVRVGAARHVDPQLAAEWELGHAPQDREFADIALFVTCGTAEHVPDQWRSKSPLGHDFRTSVGRHELLTFLTGALSAGAAGAEGPRVTLELPAEIQLALEPGVAHDLTLGLALQVGGRYRVVAHDTWPGFVLDEQAHDLSAVVRGREPRALQVRFVRERPDPGDETPD